MSADEPPAKGTTFAGISVGVDLIEHERLIETYQRFGERFLRLVFTEREIYGNGPGPDMVFTPAEIYGQ